MAILGYTVSIRLDMDIAWTHLKNKTNKLKLTKAKRKKKEAMQKPQQNKPWRSDAQLQPKVTFDPQGNKIMSSWERGTYCVLPVSQINM